MKLVKNVLFIFFLICSLKGYAIGTKIDFNIKGLENQQLYLTYEYGNKQVMVDTVKLDKDGNGYYSSKNRIPGGIYAIVFPNKMYFDVMIDDEQFFSINTDTANYFKNLVIEGSEESELFRQYQVLTNEYEKKQKELRIKKSENDSIFSPYQKQTGNPLLEARKKIDDFSAKIFNEKPKSFLAAYLLMAKDPDIPENMIYQNPEPSREFFFKRYLFIKKHYFDYISFSDTRLLRTHLIYEKLEYYFNHFISQGFDSISSAIDFVSNMSKINLESNHFVLNFLMANYRNPKNPDQERALVYLSDNYYLNGKATWADPRFLKLLQNKIDALRYSLIGNKSPDLKLQAPDDKIISLNNLEADYTIIYFWSPDCASCKIETPQLYKIYKKFKGNGLKVYAVYTHADKEIWQSYIDDKNLDWINVYDPLMKSNFGKLFNVDFTPKLYILDKDKKIVAKNMNPAQAEIFLENRFK